ncbi:hypothetical protein BHE97_01125 [Aeromicrobium sp. PE09-221]|nr:hypothetical protein BHE97_01125 [Aeromicrobium sp. PE09-221]
MPNRAEVTEAQHRTSDPVADPATDHVVAPGDTLWAIAAARLPDDADLGVVGEAVHRWHEENRRVIGEDPGLILPGQVLRAPEVR